MKKLVFASVALACLGAAATAGIPAFAQDAGGQSAQGAAANCQKITIKDPAEYNAYTNATSQSSPQAESDAIESFLKQYPNSVAKVDLLRTLMGVNQRLGLAQTLDAAKQLLAVDPNDLRALLIAVYVEHQQANGNQQQLDDAAQLAQKGLSASKDPCMSDADYQKVKDAATPVFYSAIGADDAAKKDYQGAIDAYTKELQSYKDPTQTTQVPALLDTYFLGNAYLQLDPKDLKNAIWFLTRAAQFSKPPYQAQIENAAVYWYKKFHCSTSDAGCINGNPPPGYSDIQQLAATPANVFPPSSYAPTPAPPPPSPADLAHTAIVGTPDCAGVTPTPPPAPAAPANGAAAATTPAPAAAPAAAPEAAATPAPTACTDSLKKTLGLSDEEFILENGDPQDQQLIWGIMSGVTAQVPGKVVSAAPDGTSVQLAVSQDAQQSNTADFTINMKPALKARDIPQTGATATFVATFDSYTPRPLMITMKDGTPPTPEKRTPARRTVHHPAR
ncbi:MAG TPA: hypothetical protein VMD25_11035 [Acidobacteriaceae bacterium]|nr:hypothetical protein [Acidobacteriaceae bacterium]